MQGIQPLDWLVISLYFLVILGIAWWVVKQNSEFNIKKESVPL
jgi:SSS family solute:Na+ symporter